MFQSQNPKPGGLASEPILDHSPFKAILPVWCFLPPPSALVTLAPNQHLVLAILWEVSGIGINFFYVLEIGRNEQVLRNW